MTEDSRQAGAFEIEITPEMIDAVNTELRGLNFEFESERDASERICSVVLQFRQALAL